MPITFVSGDIGLTRAQAMAISLNMRAQVAVNPLETALRDTYPVFFSDYRQRERRGGEVWIFREASPWLVGMILQDSASGIVKIRYLEQALVQLRQIWQEEGLTSLAIAPLGDQLEWPTLYEVLDSYLAAWPLPIIIYQAHIPDQLAEENIKGSP